MKLDLTPATNTARPDVSSVVAISLNLVPILTVVLALILGLLPQVAIPAGSTAPDTLVKTTVEEVLDVIKHNKDQRALRRIAEQKVLPNFDFKEMTKLAVGSAWRDADAAQQQSLENSFRTLLVNTYTTALSTSARRDSKVEVKPAQMQANQNEATVKTVVRHGGNPPMSIDYRMKNAAEGWKVYDVIVEGISLVTTYRGTFSEEVRKSGIDGLIKALDTKNQRSATG